MRGYRAGRMGNKQPAPPTGVVAWDISDWEIPDTSYRDQGRRLVPPSEDEGEAVGFGSNDRDDGGFSGEDELPESGRWPKNDAAQLFLFQALGRCYQFCDESYSLLWNDLHEFLEVGHSRQCYDQCDRQYREAGGVGYARFPPW